LVAIIWIPLRGSKCQLLNLSTDHPGSVALPILNLWHYGGNPRNKCQRLLM
jgi:hypothetical protein